MQDQDVAFHLKCARGDVGRYCLLPGDPGRCEMIASKMDEPRFVGQNREFCVWTCRLLGQKVSVCSTGIGGPSAAIAVEELAQLGADTFVRVGTCGGISRDVRGGDVVIATAAVRQEGTSREYAPIEYPAAADFTVTSALVCAAKEQKVKWHTGVVQSKDSFYGQHSPERSPVGYELLNRWDSWKRLGVKASEMEAAAIFTVSAAIGVRAGTVLHVLWNQEYEAAGYDRAAIGDTSLAIEVAIGAIKRLISQDLSA